LPPARAWLLVAALAAGCRKEAPPASVDAGGVSVSPLAVSSPAGSPLSQKDLPTTDGATAVGNLEGQLKGYLGAVADREARHLAAADFMASAIALLLTHAQFLGRLADYDRADELAERLVIALPKDGRSLILRAQVRSSLHRFADAEADLAAAERLGAKVDALATTRATVWQATGRYNDALALRRQVADRHPDLSSLGAEAALLADMGEIDRAEKLFIEAQHHFPDVAAFPVAWLYFQEGLMWQREGRLARARELLEAAVARLPAYAPAVAHLAGIEAQTGNRARAIALLRPLVDGSDDPEYPGQLADLLRADGKSDEARALREKASARYQELLAKHPEAFADHAARFYLADEPKRALPLAEKNLAARKTPDAYALVIECALAAGDQARACAAADAASTAKLLPTSHHHVVAWKAYSACNRADRAADELRAAESLAHADGGIH